MLVRYSMLAHKEREPARDKAKDQPNSKARIHRAKPSLRSKLPGKDLRVLVTLTPAISLAISQIRLLLVTGLPSAPGTSTRVTLVQLSRIKPLDLVPHLAHKV